MMKAYMIDTLQAAVLCSVMKRSAEFADPSG